jgi:thiamine pyrophosphate-dependent acetolactate synthase large subunit-like protein
MGDGCHRRFGYRSVRKLLTTDFVKFAQARGVQGWTVASDNQAREAVAAALRADGPKIIDARIDPDVTPATWIEGQRRRAPQPRCRAG